MSTLNTLWKHISLDTESQHMKVKAIHIENYKGFCLSSWNCELIWPDLCFLPSGSSRLAEEENLSKVEKYLISVIYKPFRKMIPDYAAKYLIFL